MKLLTVGIVHDGDNNNYLYFVSLILMQSLEKVLKQGTQLLKLTLKVLVNMQIVLIPKQIYFIEIRQYSSYCINSFKSFQWMHLI